MGNSSTILQYTTVCVTIQYLWGYSGERSRPYLSSCCHWTNICAEITHIRHLIKMIKYLKVSFSGRTTTTLKFLHWSWNFLTEPCLCFRTQGHVVVPGAVLCSRYSKKKTRVVSQGWPDLWPVNTMLFCCVNKVGGAVQLWLCCRC